MAARCAPVTRGSDDGSFANVRAAISAIAAGSWCSGASTPSRATTTGIGASRIAELFDQNRVARTARR